MRKATLAALCLVLVCGLGQSQTTTTTLVSVSSTGVQGNGPTTAVSISEDGRWVAFQSGATNLVPGDTNNADDIFLHDRNKRITTRVSVGVGGTQANGWSLLPSISGSGTKVAFESTATNLASGFGSISHVYVHDTATGTTTPISRNTATGAAGDGPSRECAFSLDGKWVVFQSDATNLVAGDTNGATDIFLHDLQAGVTSRVSEGSLGVQALGNSTKPSISLDGSRVAFVSDAPNLVPNDTNGVADIFVRGTMYGGTTRESLTASGAECNGPSVAASLSPTGDHVVFASDASNIVANDTNGKRDIFKRTVGVSLPTNTIRASVSSLGVQSNGDSFSPETSWSSRFISFHSVATNLVQGADLNGARDVFVHDRVASTTTRTSDSVSGSWANGSSWKPSLGGGCPISAFTSTATNIVAGDTNGQRDAFVAAPIIPKTAQAGEAKLSASDGGRSDRFGGSVSISGPTSVVGAVWDANWVGEYAGSAYVFERDYGGTDNWGELAKLMTDDAAFCFGSSVCISGDTVVVGNPCAELSGLPFAGTAYVFERNHSGPDYWGMAAKLVASDASDSDNFGASVAVNGNTIAVGASFKTVAALGGGAAYVFERDQGGPGNWGEVAKLVASDAGFEDMFGSSIALWEDTIVIGAPGSSLYIGNPGAAYIFVRNQGGGAVWGEVAKLAYADTGIDTFGQSVAIHVDTIVVGASIPSGAAFFYERNQGGAGSWGEVRQLISASSFGTSVAIHGDVAVVGDPDSSPSAAGASHVLQRDQGGANNWGTIVVLTASDATPSDRFGLSVGVSGDTALSGASGGNGVCGYSGTAYAHTISAFASKTYCTAGTSRSGCQASIAALGIASATAASGFNLVATNVEGAKDGLFFFGANGRQASPWGSGTSYQCVIPPVKRGGLLPATVGSTVGSCDGSFAQDLNALWCPTCPKPLHNPGAGATVQAQLWYRDPFNTSNQTTSLSDAVEFAVGP